MLEVRVTLAIGAVLNKVVCKPPFPLDEFVEEMIAMALEFLTRV